MLFYLLISFVIIQRIIELKIASVNRKEMIGFGAEEFDKEGYKYIVLIHILFFISLIIEYNFHGYFNQFSILFFIIFLFAQVLRYWAISSLGKYWNTRIIVLKGSPLIIKGPYKYFNHPNYLSVFLEIFSIPMIFSLYITGIFFSILNIFLLSRRIKIEDEVLRSN